MEYDHLVALANENMTPSTVVLSTSDIEHNSSKVCGNMAPSTMVLSMDDMEHNSNDRATKHTWVKKSHDATVARIEKRIATWTMLPVENGEDLQVALYEEGRGFKEHYDFLQGNVSAASSPGGQRVATVLMYLSDVESGGETSFPLATKLNRDNSNEGSHHPDVHRDHDGTRSTCGKIGKVAVKPRKGDALLFYNLTASSLDPDYLSLHVGCPVLQGKKWSATKWIHLEPFELALPQMTDLKKEGMELDDSNCEDVSPHCPWCSAPRHRCSLLGIPNTRGSVEKLARLVEQSAPQHENQEFQFHNRSPCQTISAF